MRHANRSKRLGVKTGHRVALLRNLTRGLIEHGRIKTTVARAKRLRPFVERLVTRLKNPTVANLRLADRELADKDSLKNLSQNIVPQFKDRPGGYTRILKLAKFRAGDAADMALIEWVEDSLVGAYAEVKEPKKKAVKGAKKAGGAKAKKEAKEKASKTA